MAKRLDRVTTALFPTPAVMVSCAGAGVEPGNIITLAWVGVASSDPPMLSIAIRPERFSFPLVEQSKEFVVNLATADQLQALDLCGSISGRDGDKFKAAGLTPAPASVVKAPLIAECPINIECKVRHILPLGAHHLFIGEIVAVQVDESILDEHGHISVAKSKPVTYNRGEYWSLGEMIGLHGFSVKK